MAKTVHNDVLDGALDVLKNNCTRLVLCSQQPTTFAEANTTYALADVTVDNTDFTNADGDTSGRKSTVSAQSGVTVDSTGTTDHIAYLDVINSKLLYVNEVSDPQALTSGNTVDISAHDIEIADPT